MGGNLGGLTDATTEIECADIFLPVQQNLLGLLTSAAKLAAAAGPEQQAGLLALEVVDEPASRILSVVQHAAHCIFLGYQECPEGPTEVRCVEPDAVPWLLLLVKMLRRRALRLQQLLPLLIGCDSSSSGGAGNRDRLNQVLQLLAIEVEAAVAAAQQLLGRLKMVENEGMAGQCDGAHRLNGTGSLHLPAAAWKACRWQQSVLPMRPCRS